MTPNVTQVNDEDLDYTTFDFSDIDFDALNAAALNKDRPTRSDFYIFCNTSHRNEPVSGFLKKYKGLVQGDFAYSPHQGYRCTYYNFTHLRTGACLPTGDQIRSAAEAKAVLARLAAIDPEQLQKLNSTEIVKYGVPSDVYRLMTSCFVELIERNSDRSQAAEMLPTVSGDQDNEPVTDQILDEAPAMRF